VGDHAETFIAANFRRTAAMDGEYLKSRRGASASTADTSSTSGLLAGAAGFEIVDFEIPFDYARAQKSERMASVRHPEINKQGVLERHQGLRPQDRSRADGRRREDVCDGRLFAQTMNMCVMAERLRCAADRVASHPARGQRLHALWRKSPAKAATGSVFPARADGLDPISRDDAGVPEFTNSRSAMKAGNTAEEVARACMKPIFDRGYRSGHVCGHSIGMTMIEMPRIGEGFDFVLPENMVCSMHPHFMNQERTHSLYFQETYRVGRDKGEPLSGVPIKVYHGGESSF
jgi:hypothetical protein